MKEIFFKVLIGQERLHTEREYHGVKKASRAFFRSRSVFTNCFSSQHQAFNLSSCVLCDFLNLCHGRREEFSSEHLCRLFVSHPVCEVLHRRSLSAEIPPGQLTLLHFRR